MIAFKNIFDCISICDFVHDWGLEKQFEKLTGSEIDEYDHDKCDMDLIIELLNKAYPKKDWVVEYVDDNDGWFKIYELRRKNEGNR